MAAYDGLAAGGFTFGDSRRFTMTAAGMSESDGFCVESENGSDSRLALIRSPWENDFVRLVDSVEESLVLCAPYIQDSPCRRIAASLDANGRSARLEVLVVTNLSLRNVISGVTDPAALSVIAASAPRTSIRFLPSLHAKVYVADNRYAVVTSANLTTSGLSRNSEYGVWLSDPQVVSAVRKDIEAYAALASVVSAGELITLTSAAADLREMNRRMETESRHRLQHEFRRRLEAAELDVLRIRVGGRAPHAIFADAILYLLRRHPMATVDLHLAIQSIHPDLCDDTVDRVIDGRHFGKKWKHAVRTAQQHLKKLGAIQLIEGLWTLRS